MKFSLEKLCLFNANLCATNCCVGFESLLRSRNVIYRVIPSVLDPRKCEHLKDYSLDFE
jgi:hypothetical protein